MRQIPLLPTVEWLRLRTMPISRKIAVLVPVVVAACVQPPASAPRPTVAVVRPTPTAPPAPAANWSDRAPALGNWNYVRESQGSIARFGEAGTDALFTIRCEISRGRVFISRPGVVASQMTLRSTTSAKAYPAVPTNSQPAYVVAEVAARDPQLDAMAFSRGRILIGLVGANDFVLPIWPEFTRVVEDCRG